MYRYKLAIQQYKASCYYSRETYRDDPFDREYVAGNGCNNGHEADGGPEYCDSCSGYKDNMCGSDRALDVLLACHEDFKTHEPQKMSKKNSGIMPLSDTSG